MAGAQAPAISFLAAAFIFNLGPARDSAKLIFQLKPRDDEIALVTRAEIRIAREHLRGRMLLNIRLMVVAIAASLAAIASGLGLFATFRINHEPWSAYSKAGPPLQLVAIHEMPDVPTPAALFGARLESKAGQNSGQPQSDAAAAQPAALSGVTTEAAAAATLHDAAAPLDVVPAPEQAAPAPQQVASAPLQPASTAPEAASPPPPETASAIAPPVETTGPVAASEAAPTENGHDAKPAEPSPVPAQASLDPANLDPANLNPASPKPAEPHAKEHRIEHPVAKAPTAKRPRRYGVRRAAPQTVAGQPTYQWTQDGLTAARQADLLGAAH